jgi:hypothetical protein
MSSQADRVLHPWRRFLRFSVRGLIVLVLVIGGGLGWIVREARIQREAVAAIRKAGGTVLYDWQWRDGDLIPGGKPCAPGWLVDLIGVDYFGHVTAVGLYPDRTGSDDAVLAHVGRLTRLQSLAYNSFDAEVTDAGLAHVSGLINLSYLGLSNTQVTDAGLVHLKGLTKLESMNLESTRVTDAGVRELKRALPSVTVHR